MVKYHRLTGENYSCVRSFIGKGKDGGYAVEVAGRNGSTILRIEAPDFTSLAALAALKDAISQLEARIARLAA